MDPLIIDKAIAALLIFCMSILTVIYPLKNNGRVKQVESFELGEALASGIFLGIAFLHMLPNSINTFHHLYPHMTYPVPESICIGGFLILLFLERLSLTHPQTSENAIPYILTLILIIHSLTEGAALGIGTHFAEALMIFIAIIAHKGSESFALCVTLMRYQVNQKRIVYIILFFSLMTALGIGLGAMINIFTQHAGGELAAAIFNAFAAGTFIYISALHHIRFHQRLEKSQALLEFGCLSLGLVSMGLIALWT